MRKFLILFLLLGSFALAESWAYFSLKKVPGGLMIGIEVFPSKNKSLKPLGYQYLWKAPIISPEIKNNVNYIFLPLRAKIDSLLVNVSIRRPLSSEVYNFQNKFSFSLPQVKILRKQNGLIYPLEGTLKEGDFLFAETKNFSSTDLKYIWEFNGTFLSTEKEISVKIIPENQGVLRLKVIGISPSEWAEDSQRIIIQK